MCCWSAGRSRPPSASVPVGRWRPASELEGAEGEEFNDYKGVSGRKTALT